MNQRTPNHQKSTFVKIAVSFTSLIPFPILPTDDRENTERRAKLYRVLAAKNSALFLRLSPKKVVLIPEKVVSLPKKVDSFPETVDLYSSPLHFTPYTRKIALKCDFSCTSANFVVSLHREPALGMSAHQRRRVADIIKGVYWRLFWSHEIRKISYTQSKRAINAPWCVNSLRSATMNISAWAFIVCSCV